MKATHQGTCQVCGRTQKLPSGNLSLHGYTTQWGFFAGTCHGAKAQPFELSKDLIEEAIERALEYKAECAVHALQARELKDPMKVWREEVTYKTRGEVRTWKQDNLMEVEEGKYQWESEEGNAFHGGRVRLGHNETLEDFIAKHNERRGKFWDVEVQRLERYVAWQQNRIKNWKAEPDKLVKVMS